MDVFQENLTLELKRRDLGAQILWPLPYGL
jgi:hypothetical protein